MAFHDHFSRQADRYTQFRPHYPRALFEYLATIAPGRTLAWDCGTGSGQAAVALAEFFAHVIATDASERQLEFAEPHERVRYQVAAAESSPLADGSADLVTVAQAIHWFDFDRFYPEVRRVLRPGGALAAWAYGLAEITPEVDAVVWHLYSDLLGSYWPPERQAIMDRYESIPFPFAEIHPPQFAMTAEWDLDALLGYLSTWSSAEKYIQKHGRDPLDEVREELARAWGSAGSRTVRWPLTVKLGRPV